MDVTQHTDATPSTLPTARWVAISLILLVWFVSCVLNVADRPVVREEGRWCVAGIRMLHTGQWILPDYPGCQFTDRPPGTSWCMAASIIALDRLSGQQTPFAKLDGSPLAMRLPSLLATLAMAGLLAWFTQRYLAPSFALWSAVGYLCMIQVIEFARQGETDALLTFAIAGSLLFDFHAHATRSIRWSIAAWLLVAFGILLKGPQSLLYFGATQVLWAIAARDMRVLFRLGNVIGFACGAGVIGWYAYWASLASSPQETFTLLTAQIFERIAGSSGHSRQGLLVHFLRFPIEVLGSMLPTSLFLVSAFRQRSAMSSLSVGMAGKARLFLRVAFLVILLSGMLSSNARPRYVLAAAPLLAVLVAPFMSAKFEQLSSWLAARMRARKAVLASFPLTVNPSLSMDGWARSAPALLAVGFACIIGLINILAVEARTLKKFKQAEPALAEFRQTLKPDDRMQLVGFAESWFTWYFRHHLIPNSRLTKQPASGINPTIPRLVVVRSGQVPPVADAGVAPKLSARLLLDQSNSAMDVFERVSERKAAEPIRISLEKGQKTR